MNIFKSRGYLNLIISVKGLYVSMFDFKRLIAGLICRLNPSIKLSSSSKCCPEMCSTVLQIEES